MSDCGKCEELLQPYLDRVLSVEEEREARQHLEAGSYCHRRYRFEAELRMFVRNSTVEPMPPELKERLAALRIAL